MMMRLKSILLAAIVGTVAIGCGSGEPETAADKTPPKGADVANVSTAPTGGTGTGGSATATPPSTQ
jgi:hypothetical protein